MSKMDNISRKLENGVGFSKNGWAELVLKKPPPFVPSCLMAIWDAAGPTANNCVVIGEQFPSPGSLENLSPGYRFRPA